jgi:hypothetical protein
MRLLASSLTRLFSLLAHSLLVILVRIDQLLPCMRLNMMFMKKVSEKKVLSIRCPTCGAKPGEKCELSTGLPRTDPHRDRRLAASDK